MCEQHVVEKYRGQWIVHKMKRERDSFEAFLEDCGSFVFFSFKGPKVGFAVDLTVKGEEVVDVLFNYYFECSRPPSSQRLVEAAEEAHHQHEDNPELQVRSKEKKRGRY